MRRLSRMTAPHWLALYAVLAVAWTLVWLGSTDAAWASLIRDLCATPVAAAGWPGAFAMWVVMAAAMMLPTALPAFATHDEIADAHGTGGGAALVAGYGTVWLGFAATAATLQLAVTGLSASPWFAAALLLAAGAYQFSGLKSACLSRCRAPMTFLMAHWDAGPWRMGLRLGATCLGCCWALMALGLIGGAMSLGFMALATILMIAEKLARGPHLTHAMGLACLAGAGYLVGGQI
jgi:predicted metal-binding membrane protein